MGTIAKLKRRFSVSLERLGEDSLLYKAFYGLNLLFFHASDRMKLVHNGEEDPGITYYVIRPSSTLEGLLSSYFNVAKNLLWANDKGYISYVDYENRHCQYYTGREIHGTKNAWEYYFEQPSGITRTDLSRKKNVLLSGISKDKQSKKAFDKSLKAIQSGKYREIFRSISVRKDLLEEAERRHSELFGTEKVLGVYARGTDYVSLKPKGHPIQPTIEMILSKTDEYLKKYAVGHVFVVTEDYSIYSALKTKYGALVISSDEDFVKDYRPGTYISDTFANDPYERGKNYLIRLLLLSRCDYLVSGITNGSLFARCQREEEYEDSYWFELGLYE